MSLSPWTTRTRPRRFSFRTARQFGGRFPKLRIRSTCAPSVPGSAISLWWSLDFARSTRLAPLRAADPSKIGLFGHSLGGLTAANVAAAAQGVTCAADLSGSVYGKAVRKPFRRPFLILDGQGRDPTLRGWWAKLVGTRYWVTLKTAKHLNFSDWSWLVPALRRSGVRPKPKPRVPNLGAMDGFRAVALQRRYLGAFFDKCLKHQPTSAFDDPPPADVAIKR
jgi:pimeloyl-ACP methyl ester carboxylesterase